MLSWSWSSESNSSGYLRGCRPQLTPFLARFLWWHNQQAVRGLWKWHCALFSVSVFLLFMLMFCVFSCLFFWIFKVASVMDSVPFLATCHIWWLIWPRAKSATALISWYLLILPFIAVTSTAYRWSVRLTEQIQLYFMTYFCSLSLHTVSVVSYHLVVVYTHTHYTRVCHSRLV